MVIEKMKVKRKQWIKSLQVVILTGIMLVMSGCYFLPEAEETLAPPLKEPPAITYDTMDVKKGSIMRQITGRGILESISRSDIYFNMRGGYLKNIYAKEGDEVKKGDLLVELDTDSLKVQIKQQLAQVEMNEGIYNKLKIIGKMDIESAKKQLADLNEEYTEALSVPDAYSTKELQTMENRIAQQEVTLRKLELSYGIDKLGNEGYELRQACATLEISKERLNEMQGELDKSQCFSPIDGVVVYRTDVGMGEHINTFQTLLRISNPDDVFLIYEEPDLDKNMLFKTGMKVNVEKDGNVFEGEVIMTRKDILGEFGEGKITAAESKNRQYDIVIKVKGIDGNAEMGDTYNVVLVLEKKENTIIVPNHVIISSGERKFVHVLIDGVRYERDVELGIVSGAESEIVKGLQVGEKVVVR
jgi:membrane fusion protein, macrolide-specific efflux system